MQKLIINKHKEQQMINLRGYYHRVLVHGGQVKDDETWEMLGSYTRMSRLSGEDYYVVFDRKGKKIGERQESVEDAIDKILQSVGA